MAADHLKTSTDQQLMQGWKRSNVEKTDPITNHTGETQLSVN